MSENFKFDLRALHDFYTEPNNQQTLQAASYAARVLLLPSSPNYAMLEPEDGIFKQTYPDKMPDEDETLEQAYLGIARVQIVDHLGQLAAIGALNSALRSDVRLDAAQIFPYLMPTHIVWQRAHMPSVSATASVTCTTFRNPPHSEHYMLSENTQVSIDQEWSHLSLSITEVDKQVVEVEAKEKVLLNQAYKLFQLYFRPFASREVAWRFMTGKYPADQMDLVADLMQADSPEQVEGCTVSRDEAITILRKYVQPTAQKSTAIEKLGVASTEPDLAIVSKIGQILRPLRAVE